MMKKSISAAVMAITILLVVVTSGCGAQQKTDQSVQESAAEQSINATAYGSQEAADHSTDIVRIGSLKGPTTMGLVNLMKKSSNGTAQGAYTYTMETQPDVLMADMVNGEIDIALVPANMASVLYHKTNSGVAVISVNTLGVLECVTADSTVRTVRDLSGKTVLITGQGSTPEYTLLYLLKENGVTDCKLEFKSEATEIAAELQKDPNQIAVLPQPFVSVAMMQNSSLHSAFSLSDEWDALQNGSRLLTGVTVVSRSFLEAHADAVNIFLQEQKESADMAQKDIKGTSELVAEYGIIEKAAIAQKAIPKCNIVCITGTEMKTILEGYLRILYGQEPKAVGGSIPESDFYVLQTDNLK